MHDDKPDRAIRIRKQYRNDNLYVICSYDDLGELTDIALSQTVGGPENSCTTAGLEFVASLVNAMIVRGEVGAVLEMAKAASLGSRTLPGIISSVLEQHGKLEE